MENMQNYDILFIKGGYFFYDCMFWLLVIQKSKYNRQTQKISKK